MSDTGRSHKRSSKARSSKSSQGSLAVQSSHSYEGMPRNNSTRSSRVTRDTGGYPNGPYGNQTPTPALQDYLQRPQRDDSWAPENASHAYSQDPNDTYNGPYSYSSGNGQYNHPPANPQYNNPYSNSPVNNSYNPYSNAPMNNTYNDPYNNAPVNNAYDNPYDNNPGNNSSHVPPHANRNGRIPSGDSNNPRFNNTNGNGYDTMYGRSSNSENNQNNTSNHRSRNPYNGSHR